MDDSAASREATLGAAALAVRSGGVVEVLHVRVMQPARRGLLPPESGSEAAGIVDRALTELRDRGVPARGQLRCSLEGRIAQNIVWEAEEIRADIIVLGAPARSWLSVFNGPG